ncbi:hypothetical protein QJS66_22000 [Kocuria rhizophila]|nr:hypothetical protein QJS66_22000 [Kocuria rhizophila]
MSSAPVPCRGRWPATWAPSGSTTPRGRRSARVRGRPGAEHPVSRSAPRRQSTATPVRKDEPRR